MAAFSFRIDIPDTQPFDRQDNWFETFAGSVIAPVVASGHLQRFWFTRYGGVSHGKHALFRVETDDKAAVLAELQKTTQSHSLQFIDEGSYDPAGDIGSGRFLGTNAMHQDTAKRGELALTFLHAAACLMLDCLVGPDADGYFSLEEEKASKFSRESSLEQFHHLFCNLTGAPVFIGIGQPPGQAPLIPMSDMEIKQASGTPGWQFYSLRKAMF